MDCSDIFLIAHRGESYDAPENTLAAVNLAWERKADAVEIDVRLSKDGKVVVIHDNTTGRTGGRNKDIRDQTLEELRLLDVGRYKGYRWARERIPTLREILETVPKGKRLYVEIKCGTEILPELEAVLSETPPSPEQVILIGLHLATMSRLKKQFSRHEVCWVCNLKKDTRTGIWEPGVDEMVSKALEAGMDGLDVLACEAVDRAFVGKVKSAGLKLYVWTVNDPAEARRLCRAGIDGITTDRPEWLRKKLHQQEVISCQKSS
jgi:glycerophosphoryl diester phosphodiesterase